MFKKLLFCFLILTFAFFNSAKVFAYHPDTTHAALTDEIVDFYNYLHLDNQITAEEKEWIVYGSIEEDEEVRALNHLYDPVRKIAWNDEHVGSEAIAQLAQSAAVAPAKPTTAIDWVNNRILQSRYQPYGGDRTWRQGLEYLVDGNKKEAYITLGHTLHLLEDMSVPDHTRNDAHPPLGEHFGSPYEDYAKKWNRNNISREGILEKLKGENTKPPQLNSIEEYLESMAQYSNRYFFSKDTINELNYSLKVSEDDCDTSFCYGTDEKGEVFPLTKFRKNWNEQKKEMEIAFEVQNKPTFYPILNAYFSRLAPKAVLYGAGVIELFNRQKSDMEIAREFPSSIVKLDRSNIFVKLFTSSWSVGGELSKLKNKFVSLIDTVANLPDIFSKSSKPEIIDLTQETQNQIRESGETDQQTLVESPKINQAELKNQLDDEYDRLSGIAVEENKSDRSNETNKTNRTNTTLAVSSGGGGSSGNQEAAPQFFPVIINEIMYDLLGADDGREWIEIFNNGTTTVDLSSWKFFENNTNHTLTLIQGSVNLLPGGYAIITASTTKFLEDNPAYNGALFDSSFSLSNSGETIAIKNDTLLIDEVTYSSSTGANGNGDSLQLIGSSWQAAVPTPGEENEISPIGPIGPISPIASFSYLPQNPEPGENVLFNAASSTAASSTIVSYFWDFGDEDATTTPQATSTHIYSTAGTYIVSLKVLDNTNASSTATSTISVVSPPVAATSTNHVVISEIMAGTSGAADSEWVELYNPTNQIIDLTGWSLKRKATFTATTTSNLVFAAGFTDSIGPQKFFLIASQEWSGGKNPDISYSQVSNHLAQSEDVLLLYNANGDVVDEIAYSSIDFDKSLERRAWQDGNCVSAQIAGEFLGNGCDTDSDADFEIRVVPNPQNSASLPEPREAPTAIASFTVGYHFSIPTFTMNWSSSTDYSGATSTIRYEIQELNAPTSSTPFNLNSTSTALEQVIDEVGRNYEFSVKAVDTDGLASTSTLASTTVPSFINNLYFYADPRASSTGLAYLTELYYSQYPFISQAHGSGASWRMMAFYLNKEAEKVTPIVNPRSAQDPSYHIDGMISFRFKRCNGSVQGSGDGYAVILPDAASTCQSAGPNNGDLSFNLLEDNHFIIAPGLSATPSSTTDYVTMAFYDFAGSLEGFRLVAADKTKYYFQDSAPPHQAPTAPTNLAVDSHTINSPSSTVTLSWSPSTDADSLDVSNLSYEWSLDSNSWQILVLVPGANSSKLYANIPLDLGGSYIISLRAVDDFSVTSATSTISLNLPAPVVNNTPVPSNSYFAVDEAKIDGGLLKIKWRLLGNPAPSGTFGIIPYLNEIGPPPNFNQPALRRALHRDYDGNLSYPETTANSPSQCNAALTPFSNYTLGWQYGTHFSSVSGQTISDAMAGKELRFNIYTSGFSDIGYSCGVSVSSLIFSGLPVVISN